MLRARASGRGGRCAEHPLETRTDGREHVSSAFVPPSIRCAVARPSSRNHEPRQVVARVSDRLEPRPVLIMVELDEAQIGEVCVQLAGAQGGLEPLARFAQTAIRKRPDTPFLVGLCQRSRTTASAASAGDDQVRPPRRRASVRSCRPYRERDREKNGSVFMAALQCAWARRVAQWPRGRAVRGQDRRGAVAGGAEVAGGAAVPGRGVGSLGTGRRSRAAAGAPADWRDSWTRVDSPLTSSSSGGTSGQRRARSVRTPTARWCHHRRARVSKVPVTMP